MSTFGRTARSLAVGTMFAAAVGTLEAQPLTWATIVNNGYLIPGTAVTFNSFNQPSVNASGQVVFRGRSKGGSGGGQPVHGIYQSNPLSGKVSPIVEITSRGKAVPQPNNTFYTGAPASFREFPSTPRIDIASPMIATRGQSQPVYEYQTGIDPVTGLPVTTRVGTSGVYANPGGVLVTGASLLGAVRDFPSGNLTFPHFAVPGAPAGTRFDQFPGSPTVTNGTIIAFKGNYTDPSDGLGRTGVYYRDVVANSGLSPIQLVANSTMLIPNPPGAPPVIFGSTAPPSAANGYMVFTGLDIEAAPTRGGIYRAPLQPTPPLQTLAGIGDQVPGEAAGVGFNAFGEGLSISADARYVAFWAAWGSETFTRVLYCPVDGNADIIAYCNATYPSGYTVAIPLHQGIFVADANSGRIFPIAKTLADGYTDFLFWVFSGRPPGTGGGEEVIEEPARWRASAFTALSGTPGFEAQTAFKAAKAGFDGIYLRKGRSMTAPLVTVVETLNSMGQAIDPQAPANSIVTAVGIERDGFRNGNLTVSVAMLYEDALESVGWAGLYLTKIAQSPPVPDPVATTTSIASSLNPSTVGASVTFTATITGNAPTGTVNFMDGASSIAGCDAKVVTGTGNTRQAVCTTSGLTQGTHDITATYSGDALNLASASPLLSQVVNASGQASTTTTLTSSLNPSRVGISVTFTAAISGNSPTGTVNFMDAGTSIPGCSAQALDGTGHAQCATSGLAQGVHSITAGYSGDAANLSSVSVPLSQVVNAALNPTTTVLSSSRNPSVFGTSVTFTATVTGITSAAGTVAFTDGANAIAGCSAVPLVPGRSGYTAACTTSALTVGTHNIVAHFSGDAASQASDSVVLAQVVTSASGPTGTTTSVVSSQMTASYGTPVTFTATVTGANPTGSVAFKDGVNTIAGCAEQAVSGVGNTFTAVCTTSSLAVGRHAITAVYGGDAANLPSTSVAIMQVIF